MLTDDQIHDAYRTTLVAALHEAQEKGDVPMQQRVKLMIELHEKNIARQTVKGRAP